MARARVWKGSCRSGGEIPKIVSQAGVFEAKPGGIRENLAEFFVAVTQKLPNPISGGEAKELIKDINSFSFWKVLSYNQETVEQAIHLFGEGGRDFWDALLVATMLKKGIYKIYTENTKDFSAYSSIKAINPFEKRVS